MEILIVGSGAGGATLAKELSIQGVSVTVLESGRYHKLGTERRAMGFYTGSFWKMRPGEMFKEGAGMLRTVMVGGSTMVTLGKGVRSLQDELDGLGINLEEEFQEVETELNVKPLPEEFMGDRTRILMEAAEELGYDARPMPKFINFSRCKKCGMCVTGCPYGAKWTAQNFLAEARKAGARILILLQAGVRGEFFYTTRVRGGHLGGTAGINRIVNKDQETEVNGLFVSDASVLPEAPGAPHVLMIVALSKRLSKLLLSEYL
ncbi:MAG: GMC family oxidoreductase [Candidatus Korarchaeota archaeon]|nr:GMC family oxidoreductase [Candidatus Korarchaeota archaeon]